MTENCHIGYIDIIQHAVISQYKSSQKPELNLNHGSDLLNNELQVLSLRVGFIAPVTSCEFLLLHELRVSSCIIVMCNYCLFHGLRDFYL